MQAKKISLIIESRTELVYLAGTAINKLASVDLNSEEAGCQTELAVVEALNNSIKHSYEDKPGKEIRIDYFILEDRIRIEISDTGKPVKKYTGKMAHLSFEPDDLSSLPEGGMGIFLISKIMDEVTYLREDKKNKLIMLKYLKKD